MKCFKIKCFYPPHTYVDKCASLQWTNGHRVQKGCSFKPWIIKGRTKWNEDISASETNKNAPNNMASNYILSSTWETIFETTDSLWGGCLTVRNSCSEVPLPNFNANLLKTTKILSPRGFLQQMLRQIPSQRCSHRVCEWNVDVKQSPGECRS